MWYVKLSTISRYKREVVPKSIVTPTGVVDVRFGREELRTVQREKFLPPATLADSGCQLGMVLGELVTEFVVGKLLGGNKLPGEK